LPVSRHPLAGPVPTLKGVGVDRHASRRLRESLTLLGPNAESLVSDFYAELVERFPDAARAVPAGVTGQEAEFLNTLWAIVQTVDDEPTLVQKLSAVAERYSRFGARPEHFPIVSGIVLRTMARHGGSAWTTELHSEWSQTLRLVGARMISATGGSPPKTAPEKKRRS